MSFCVVIFSSTNFRSLAIQPPAASTFISGFPFWFFENSTLRMKVVNKLYSQWMCNQFQYIFSINENIYLTIFQKYKCFYNSFQPIDFDINHLTLKRGYSSHILTSKSSNQNLQLGWEGIFFSMKWDLSKKSRFWSK